MEEDTMIPQPQTLSEFEELLEKTTSLKKDLRMVKKMTNSEKILNLGTRLDEILPVLPGTIEDLKARALASKGEDRKRLAHLGVQFQQLEKGLKDKQSDITAGLVSLSDEETKFLGLAPKKASDLEEDDPAEDGDEDSYESSEPNQQGD